MTLVLTLVGPPRLMGARQIRELRAGSLSIGRSPEADWVIPDNDRLISRLHCRIDAGQGDFVLTDTSSNGVCVNDGADPVGYGASVKLRDGDRLRIGEAQIAVAIRADARDEAGPATNGSARPANFNLDADAFSAQIARSPSRDPLGGPFGAEAAAVPPRAPPAQTAPARTVIDANWMNTIAEPAVAPARPTILPIRPSSTAPEGHGAARTGPRPDALSVLAILGADADASALRLASAIDATRPLIDPHVWGLVHQRIKDFMQNNSIRGS